MINFQKLSKKYQNPTNNASIRGAWMRFENYLVALFLFLKLVCVQRESLNEKIFFTINLWVSYPHGGKVSFAMLPIIMKIEMKSNYEYFCLTRVICDC